MQTLMIVLQTEGRTNPNYIKASILKIALSEWKH